MANDPLTPEVKTALDAALKKAHISDKSIVLAEQAASEVAPQIQAHAAVMEAVNALKKTKIDASDPHVVENAQKIGKNLMDTGQALQQAEDKALLKLGVSGDEAHKIEFVTLDVTRKQSATIVAKGATVHGR